jgi:hypothetical protein
MDHINPAYPFNSFVDVFKFYLYITVSIPEEVYN